MQKLLKTEKSAWSFLEVTSFLYDRRNKHSNRIAPSFSKLQRSGSQLASLSNFPYRVLFVKYRQFLLISSKYSTA